VLQQRLGDRPQALDAHEHDARAGELRELRVIERAAGLRRVLMPVKIVSCDAWSRCVIGMPAYAGPRWPK